MASTLRQGGTSFSFLPILPEEGPRPDDIVHFRAFISNVADSYGPQWNEHMDMGRADPKFMYNNFTRSITVDFMTAALYRGEHFSWLQALNRLSQMSKPLYDSGNRGFNGIFVQIEIGNLINEKGVLTNVDYVIDNETPWVDDVPIYVSANIAFRVLGQVKPDYNDGRGGLYDRSFGSGISD